MFPPPSHNFFFCLCAQREPSWTLHVCNHSRSVSPHALFIACTPESLAHRDSTLRQDRACKQNQLVCAQHANATPPNRRDVISSGSTYCAQLNNKPKVQECIYQADTAGQKKRAEYIRSFFLLFFFPLLLTATKQKTSRFKCYIKMSSKASPGNNTSEGKGLPEADSGFFV